MEKIKGYNAKSTNIYELLWILPSLFIYLGPTSIICIYMKRVRKRISKGCLVGLRFMLGTNYPPTLPQVPQEGNTVTQRR